MQQDCAIAVNSLVSKSDNDPRFVEDCLSRNLLECWLMDKSTQIFLIRQKQGIIVLVHPLHSQLQSPASVKTGSARVRIDCI